MSDLTAHSSETGEGRRMGGVGWKAAGIGGVQGDVGGWESGFSDEGVTFPTYFLTEGSHFCSPRRFGDSI